MWETICVLGSWPDLVKGVGLRGRESLHLWWCMPPSPLTWGRVLQALDDGEALGGLYCRLLRLSRSECLLLKPFLKKTIGKEAQVHIQIYLQSRGRVITIFTCCICVASLFSVLFVLFWVFFCFLSLFSLLSIAYLVVICLVIVHLFIGSLAVGFKINL